MKVKFLSTLALTAMLLAMFASFAVAAENAPQADSSDAFFDDSYVHEIYLTFDAADYGTAGWYNTLYDSHANNPDDPYFPAGFSADDVTIDMVGVRFKGNSSFSGNGIKKSFKIDFNEYEEVDEELLFYDLKKLNLSNGFKDPTLLREKLFLDFAGNFVTAPRAVHTKIYVNGAYYGLYTAIEQIDKTFVQNRFGDDEDGNLYKGTASDAINPSDDFGSDLTWLGSDPVPYYDFYALKTNETANDYTQLVDFIDVLNNGDPAEFPTTLEPLFDVDDALQGMALNNLFVNIDSYSGAAHNYYVYDRDDTGQITHIPWDTNESFGGFTRFIDRGSDPLDLEPFWLPSSITPGVDEVRPMMENLWANDQYSNDYLCDLQQMLDSGFDAVTMNARIDQLADLIRDDVAADPNNLYSAAQFEAALYNDVQDGRDVTYGLSSFVQERASYLNAELATYALECAPDIVDLSETLFINEFMADNETVLEDPTETGDYPDWIELYNAGAADIDLQGMFLTDDLTNPTQHAITQTLIVPANGYLLLYADGDLAQGVNHLDFKLGSGGEDLAIFNSDGATLIDGYTFGAQAADTSEGRCPNGGDDWIFFSTATPGASNEPCASAPIISNVTHLPISPTDADAVVVTAVITDDVTVATASLWYSIDGNYTEIVMTDDGSNNYSASIPAQADDSIVTYYIVASDGAGFTTSEPANAPTAAYSYFVGYDAPVLYLNELMADNAVTLEDPDEAGDYPDWFELYNPGTDAIDLSGLYLTDDLSDPTQFQIPDGVMIAAGEFLIFYADGDTDQGDLHTNFGLGKSGESLALFGADGIAQIDAVTFLTQTTDVAYGRQVDGTGSWNTMSTPTPNGSNIPTDAPPTYVSMTSLPVVTNQYAAEMTVTMTVVLIAGTLFARRRFETQ